MRKGVVPKNERYGSTIKRRVVVLALAAFLLVVTSVRFASIQIPDFENSGIMFELMPHRITSYFDIEKRNSISSRYRYWVRPEDEMSESERTYASPLSSPSSLSSQFLTFEPDIGQLNNVRLNLEVMVALSAALGRTLVLPHGLHRHLCGHTRPCDGREGRPLTLTDFFDFSGLKAHGSMINTITMAEYVARYAPENIGVPEIPSERSPGRYEQLEHVQWLRESGYVVPFGENPEQRGKSPGEPYTKSTSKTRSRYIAFSRTRNDALRDPATSEDVRELLQRRYGIGSADVPYDIMRDPRILSERTIHFGPINRVLGCFYCVLYFEDDDLDDRIKRLVRDGVRYPDPAFVAAGRIVDLLEKEQNGRGFTAMHVRRNDFHSFKPKHMYPSEFLLGRLEAVDSERTVYIATDETSRAYFDSLTEFYDLNFLGDFENILDSTPGFKAYMIPQVDQIVASHGKQYLGTRYSTFSAYILRLRGYLGKASETSAYITGDPTPLSDERACNAGASWLSEYPSGWNFKN